jgi:putative polyhydroxyalkanoate system protein
MPKFEVTVPHPMSAEDSREKLVSLLSKLQEHYQNQLSGLTHEWQGNTMDFSFSTFGFKITGAMSVADQQVTVRGDLPFAASLFKGKIEGDIRQQLEKLLN